MKKLAVFMTTTLMSCSEFMHEAMRLVADHGVSALRTTPRPGAVRRRASQMGAMHILIFAYVP